MSGRKFSYLRILPSIRSVIKQNMTKIVGKFFGSVYDRKLRIVIIVGIYYTVNKEILIFYEANFQSF